MCNVYLAWYIYTAQWIWFGIYPGEPACKKTCGSVHPRLVGQLSDTISSPWNSPKISDSNPVCQNPPDLLVAFASWQWRRHSFSPPLFPRRSPAASSSSPAPELRSGPPPSPTPAGPRRPFVGASMSGPSNNRVGVLSVLFFFCIEHFDVEVMEWSAIKKKDAWMWFCLCYVSFLSAVVGIFRWFDDFAQLVLSYYERVSIHVEE